VVQVNPVPCQNQFSIFVVAGAGYASIRASRYSATGFDGYLVNKIKVQDDYWHSSNTCGLFRAEPACHEVASK